MDLDKVWSAEFEQLRNLPTSEERTLILAIWRKSVYLDRRDPQISPEKREQMANLEIDMIIKAYLCGFMARRKWIEETEAQAFVKFLGRDWLKQCHERDLLTDAEIESIEINVSKALQDITQLGISLD